ncbi:MAG: hypothetical protein HXS54_03670 [Theionarchaea archaeon]|nr:hypothetical protein [Theionarchaea archaeon]
MKDSCLYLLTPAYLTCPLHYIKIFKIEIGNITKTLIYKFSEEKRTILTLILYMLRDTTVSSHSFGIVCIALKRNLFMVDVYRERR